MRYTKEDYKTTNWSGGTTTELRIYPSGAEYTAKDFGYRISSARVDLDNSDFTKLPGVQRKLMILDGNMSISHCYGPFQKLTYLTEHSFMGDWYTKSRGQCTDFNLMLRDGVEGSISVIKSEGVHEYEADHIFMYLYQGRVTLKHNPLLQISDVNFDKREEVILEDQQSLFLEAQNGKVIFSIEELSKEAVCILCQIRL